MPVSRSLRPISSCVFHLANGSEGNNLARDRIQRMPAQLGAIISALSKDQDLLALLKEKSLRLRIDSIRATTTAGSGHPTSCASAAEIMATLFFSVMQYDPNHPLGPASDQFVLSKGHAAPILYAAWAEAGA